VTRLRVAVLFGGRSGEHEVSLLSARAVLAALDPARYEVIPVGITRAGRWLLPGDVERALREGPEAAGGTPVVLLPDPTVRGLLPLSPRGEPAGPPIPVDVVFPVLHGTFGEDGTVQGLLELAGVAYVGAGVLASAVGMDKVVMKDLFVRHGLPVVRYRAFLRRTWRCRPERVLAEVEAELGYPVFVKPANLGSSVGISRASDRQALARGLEEAARYDRKLLVEKAVVGAREIEVSVLGNDEPEASVPGEVVPATEFYTYDAKYRDPGTRLLVPAPLPPAQVEEFRRLAVAAYRAIDCAGMARVDFFLAPHGSIYVNEINTIPGFTQVSMYPRLWQHGGMDYPALVDRLIRLALERWRELQELSRTYG